MHNDTTSRAGPTIPYEEMRKDADELLRAANRARKMFVERPARTFGRLSTLLDEVLPADRQAAARVARAVELDPNMLSRLRANQVDPLELPGVPLASLGQTLTLDEDTYFGLLEADHAVFRTWQGAARGPGSAADPRQAVRSAWQRAAMDLPG